MSLELEEMLQSDLEAMQPQVFKEHKKQASVFIVAQMEIEVMFAITCHRRMAQRQRTNSLKEMATPVPDGSCCLCQGALELLAAEESGLRQGWLSSQITQPQGNPLLQESQRHRNRKSPPQSLAGQGQPALVRQGIPRGNCGCHASKAGTPGVLCSGAECLLGGLPEYWGTGNGERQRGTTIAK